MKAKLVLMLVVAMLATAVGAYAHHSFAATYDERTTVTITGKIVQFSFRNPHSFITVEVSDGKEKVRWGVEGPGSTQLNNSGVQNDTLKYGDTVVITGNPSRNPTDHKLRLRTMKRPDGFNWGFTEEQKALTEQ